MLEYVKWKLLRIHCTVLSLEPYIPRELEVQTLSPSTVMEKTFFSTVHWEMSYILDD